MPAIRPRSSSGIDWFHIVVRKSPEIMSAPPAKASATSPIQSSCDSPKAVMPTPQNIAAMHTATPWRFTSAVQPLVAVTISEPAAGAA